MNLTRGPVVLPGLIGDAFVPGGGHGAVPALPAGASDAGQTGGDVCDPAAAPALRAASTAAVGLHHVELPHRLHHVLRTQSHGEQPGTPC